MLYIILFVVLSIIIVPSLNIWLYIKRKGKKMVLPTLQGFDISGFQNAEPNVTGKNFGIVKSTEGTALVNLNYSQQLAWLRKNNLIVGHYHFPHWGDMAGEAAAFIQNSDFQVNEFAGIDVETEIGVVFPANPVPLVRQFADAFHAALGFWPMVYMNLNVLGNYDWSSVSKDCGLWLADWNPTLPNGVAPWQFIAIWQKADTDETEGDYDEFEGDASQLDAYGYHPNTPVPPAPTPEPAPVPVPPQPAPAPPAYQVYVVQSGDTLSGIADRFGIGLGTLESVNPQIADFNLIFPGEHINIPSFNPPAPPITVRTYQVQSGDTMSGIADQFGVSLADLESANPQITNPDLIYPGQILTIS